MIIGTAGHIDHGKTALIKALTGVDADRLKEEKARGITIDLGYAYHALPGGEALGFVDVPGHERLVHNMLAGATGIDFVLLVVAADDGVMPQTREHVHIVHLLGLARGAVALTKTDRVAPGRVAEVEAQTKALLASTVLAGSPIYPVSSITGAGIGALRERIEAAARDTGLREVHGHFRLAIDRCFTLTGSGTVVTGTVYSGQVQVGDTLVISPAGRPVRVRGIHAQNRPANEGRAGQRCALNLTGVEKSEIARGDWVLAPAAHAPTSRVDARVTLLGSETRALADRTPVHAHVGAADILARVTVLQESIAPGGGGLAQLVFDRPVAALRGDRVILRDQSARRTIGGGVVLDPFAPARKRRTPARLAMLDALERPSAGAALDALLAQSPFGVDLDRFALMWNRPANTDGWRDVSMMVIETPPTRLAIAPRHWSALRQAAIEALADQHARVPGVLGLNAVQLRAKAAAQLPWSAFSVLIEGLLEDGRLARRGAWLHLPGHAIRLSVAEARLWERVAPLLRAEPFEPPRVRDIARTLGLDEAQVRALLQRVALIGDVYLIAHDHYFDRDAVDALARIARELADEIGEVRAADFRDRIKTGRKLAIRILEYFDRMGFSRRVGEGHRLRNPLLFPAAVDDGRGPVSRQ